MNAKLSGSVSREYALQLRRRVDDLEAELHAMREERSNIAWQFVLDAEVAESVEQHYARMRGTCGCGPCMLLKSRL